MSNTVILYWDVLTQKWQIQNTFKPGDNSGTFGGQLFLLPSFCVFDGSNFYLIVKVPNASFSGDYNGSLKAGKDTVENGSISATNVSITENIPLTLETDSGCKYPYLSYSNVNLTMIPVNVYNVPRGPK